MIKKAFQKTDDIQSELGYHIGDRNKKFKVFIKSILEKYANITDTKYLAFLLTESSLKVYGCAFTSEEIDQQNNYQFFELLGDLSVNKYVVEYVIQKFPQLEQSQAVKIIARLRINNVSKSVLSKIAKELKFLNYISAPNDTIKKNEDDLLEDTFEAFVGVTEKLLNEKFGYGIGCTVVRTLIFLLFEEKIKLSLEYIDLYDSKTRLKELVDMLQDKIGKLEYVNERDIEKNIVRSIVYTKSNNVKTKIGEGVARLQNEAEKNASDEGIKYLNTKGFVKHPPKIYTQFAKNCFEKKQITKEEILAKIGEVSNIDNLFPTQGKSKYQSKYMSTWLSFYCKERDFNAIKICLKYGANPNVQDSCGMTALDLLCVGNIDIEFMQNVFNKVMISGHKMDIHKNIFDNYLTKYKSDNFFSDIEQNVNLI
jgi:dsRNA-specific ribonuclease